MEQDCCDKSLRRGVLGITAVHDDFHHRQIRQHSAERFSHGERLRGLLRADTPDPTQVLASHEVGMLTHFFRQVIRMLDNLTIHVRHVKSTFRPSGEEDWPEPVIPGGQQLTVRIHRLGGEGGTSGNQPVRMDEVARGIAGQHDVQALGRQQGFALPDLDPTGGTKRTSVAVGSGEIRTYWEKTHTVMPAVDTIKGVAFIAILHSLGKGQPRVSLQPVRPQHDVLHW